MLTSDPALVTATATLTGLHHWPDAPPRRAYLSHPHRHVFHLEATVRVGHDDREVEFHDLAELLPTIAAQLGTPYADTTITDLGATSCEQLARYLAASLEAGGLTVHSVRVSEDGENHATIERGQR